MNVGTIKLLSWLSSLLMLTATVVGVTRFMKDLDTHEKPLDASYIEQVLSSDMKVQVDVHEGLRYGDHVRPAFIGMNWSGKPKPKPVANTNKIDKPTIVKQRPVADSLRILFILRDSNDPSESYATAVPVKGAQQDQLNLKVGDRLPKPNSTAIVHMIHDESVEFVFTDERENEKVLLRPLSPDIVIVKEGDAIKEGEKFAIPKGGDREDMRPQETQVLAPNHFQLGQNDLDEFSRDYSRILNEDVRTRTHYDESGNRAGVEIQSVKAGSIASKHGAMDGDIVISINGHKVGSEQEAIQFVKKNNDKYKVWTVEVMRLGRIETVVYNSGN